MPWILAAALPFLVLGATWWRVAPGPARRAFGWGAVVAATFAAVMVGTIWRASAPTFVCCFGIWYGI